jgi:rhodanese-related sulfurtransferase
MDLRRIAFNYLSKGLSVIPIDNLKRPTIHSWYEFQKRYMTPEEVEKYFKDAWGIAVLGGTISSDIEGYSLIMIDVDTKNFDDQITYKQVVDAIPEDIFKKLVVVSTMNGGYHWYLRAPIAGRNQKFAMRPTSEEERKENPKELMRVLLESRANGGYCLAPVTPGYEVISNNKKIHILDLDEYYSISDSLGSFNRVINEGLLFEQFQEEKKNKFLVSPFDDYNKRENALNILMRNGYSVVGDTRGDKIMVKRQGNSSSKHSGYIVEQGSRYINFSTSTGFDSSKSYSCSELFTLLECENNWSKSYKALIEMGYGHSVNMDKNVREFVDAFRKGNLMRLLEIQFAATKTDKGIEINNKTFNIKL